jgi:hypothetical protein
MPQSTEHEHVLLNPRLIAAVGLIALGGGIGITLMTARILIYVGLAISLTSAAGVFWIYGKHLLRAYRAIGNRIPYRGPQVAELLVAATFAVVLAAVSVAVFSLVIITEPPSGRAILQAGPPEFVKIPSDAPAGFINVKLRNTGNLSVENANILMTGRIISPADITMELLNSEMSALMSALDEVEKRRPAKSPMYPQIHPGSAAVITLEDVRADQWRKLLETNVNRDLTFPVTDDQWKDFQQGKLSIFVLYAAKFEDEAHRGTSYWKVSHCMWFRGTVAFSHTCGENRADLVAGPRR